MYGKGISREGSLLDVGVDLGLVKKSGAWFTYDGEQLGQGRENAKVFLVEHPEVMVEISERIRSQLGIGTSPTPVLVETMSPRPTTSPSRSTRSTRAGTSRKRAVTVRRWSDAKVRGGPASRRWKAGGLEPEVRWRRPRGEPIGELAGGRPGRARHGGRPVARQPHDLVRRPGGARSERSLATAGADMPGPWATSTGTAPQHAVSGCWWPAGAYHWKMATRGPVH